MWIVDRIAKNWKPFADVVEGLSKAGVHRWEDDAQWFGEQFAMELRGAGFEMASDWLRGELIAHDDGGQEADDGS